MILTLSSNLQSKIVAKKFKELDAEQRSKYEKLADKDKLRYDKEMENYTPQPDDEKSGKKKKDPNAPKKPLSAYNYFCAANRGKLLKKQPDASFSDLVRNAYNVMFFNIDLFDLMFMYS